MPQFVGDLRRMGFVNWFAYAADRALEKASGGWIRARALWFYAQPVDLIPQTTTRPGDRISTTVVSRAELPEGAFGRPHGAFAKRFDQGSICIAARRDSELIGFMWLQFDELREQLFRCDFIPCPHGRAAWDFDLYVAPELRLSKAFARLWSHARSYLCERGIETTISWIAFDNDASQRAHRRMGAKRVGWAIVLTAGSARVVLSTARPYLSAGLKDSRTRLFVDSS
ncbi:MAG: GNAT family N-acetyltransferase [Burkholderiaceae bacterium]|nr:GNAT family N-acetyltransferase [Burkholderiaceae bacterium]